ncbi:class I SAM-dependent methyltransferase [Mangrovimicrobium sediminis]|uniref:Class I SAM-dependent methyltransferase n=1 Tax=Mangrovimicrobium sediminis TaxID=2562682 RepID=A0A4Z0M4B0_9GAMM|nr:class I SAM-dependent methyltransferase [Haliea sp. SAOS-164]TGD74280.1 class I SAM-dependent methyltransferase [Haliea sp. SAOS-164]
MSDTLRCPLCDGQALLPFHRDRRREYLRCGRCALVCVPPRYHLDAAREKAEYDLHRNAPDDAGYRRFLGRLAQPLLAHLPPAARGLDFGCGPGPALAAMLEEAGHSVALYDPFYFPESAALERRYQFITATEVVEHLRAPGQELARLWGLLEPGGVFGIMTKLVLDADAFANWHYKNDPTHICFFSEQTWQWWAGEYGARLQRHGADVMLLWRD